MPDCRRSKIRDALADTRDFQGVTGTISFDDFGDLVKSVVIMKIQDGQRIYLKQVRPRQLDKIPTPSSLNG